jgi:starch-binding outer membrane protein, SusD/RagB family
MKNIYNILIVSTFLVSINTGCKKDFLDKQNPNQILVETFYKTDADAVRAVNAAYAPLQQLGLYQRLYHMATDLPSDETAGTGSLNPGWYALKNFTTNSNLDLTTELWRSCYQGITRANLVLENCGTIDMDVTKRSRILAEAKFLRALYHFHLVMNYGDVPLMLKVPKLDDPDAIKFPVRTPKLTVYTQIIQDLNDAAADLPLVYGAVDIGRATQGAAKGYLGKVYLYLASDDPANKITHYTEARDKLAEVMASSTYSLVPVYRDNHTSTNENNPESLFEVQFGAGYGTAWAIDNGGGEGHLRAVEFGVAGHAFHNVIPSQKIVQEFAPNDSIRILGSMFGPGNTYDGLPYSKKGPTLATSGIFENAAGYNPSTNSYSAYYAGYAIRKYEKDAGTFENTDQGSDVNIRILRYADILLMHAEAQNELNNIALAEPDINLIRDRVNMAHVPPGLTQAAMRDTIIHERMVELAFEEVRYHDLKRWYKSGASTVITTALPGIPLPKYLYLPIPQTEMDVNKNLVQNPGW